MVTGSLAKCERCDGTSRARCGGYCRVCDDLPYQLDPAYMGTPLGTIALPISPAMLEAFPEWLTQWTHNEDDDEHQR